ncbi:AAA family ATPase [Leclercia sp.]|uniref:AAA family ATPase n=1 Tax=Leclercia sp. TaxID=1898428 RepID=UPI00289B7C0C|nr:DUF3696 domain-containing protein [Leclercia sp.]
MLKKLGIENFKSFSEYQTIDLAPLTLIFGPNSSGKSSIIHSLLALKQTINNPNESEKFISTGKYVDLGSFGTVVYKHNLENKIKISLSFTSNLSIEEYESKYNKKPTFGMDDVRKFEVSYAGCEDSQKKYKSSLEFFSYEVSQKNNFENLVKFRLEQSSSYHKDLNYYIPIPYIQKLTSYLVRKEKRSGTNNSDPEIYNAIINPDFRFMTETSIPFRNNHFDKFPLVSQFFTTISDEIKSELASLIHLGPLRTYPKRFYASDEESSVNNKGETNIGAKLYDADDRSKEKINEWFGKFEIPYKFTARNIGNYGIGDVVAVILHDLRSKINVTPADVGFGIGQVLPIIIDSTIFENKTICVEQPEIHLHPRLQAHLADLFIDSIQNNNNQWIIETHSESLMLRIQRRIREGKITSNDVKVLYVENSRNGSIVIDIPLNSKGDFLKHWPDGFFEERISEMFGGKK